MDVRPPGREGAVRDLVVCNLWLLVRPCYLFSLLLFYLFFTGVWGGVRASGADERGFRTFAGGEKYIVDL